MQHEANERNAWHERAGQLADWTMQRIVVRTDAHARYGLGADDGPRKIDARVTPDLIVRHFHADAASDTIGLYTTAIGDDSRMMTIDLDRHDGDSQAVADANFEFAKEIYERVKEIGFTPLMIDSNGNGGIHLQVISDQPVPAMKLRSLGRWLSRDWRDRCLLMEPEVFPKQNSIGNGYGNFVRLIGRHPKSRRYARVWNGQCWLLGDDAIGHILGIAGDSIAMAPREALEYTPAKASDDVHGWLREYRGDLRTLDIQQLFETKGLSVELLNGREREVTCPWSDEHTTGQTSARVMMGDTEEDALPTFNCFHNHCKDRRLPQVLACFETETVDACCAAEYNGTGQASADSHKVRPVISPTAPRTVARKLVEDRFLHEGTRTLVYDQEKWKKWDGFRYTDITNDEVRAETYEFLESCDHRVKSNTSSSGDVVPFAPNRSHVSNVLDALRALCNLRGQPKSPCWLGNADGPEPMNTIAFKNGLLDVGHLIATGDALLLPHSPEWFSTTCLPHDFDGNAECPAWIGFLDEVLQGDRDCIRTLRQWFGYNLTLDTRQQKFLMLIGTPRSGKGTTARILGDMVGRDNVANPSLSSLGTRFGLAPLLGKQAAIVTEGHIGRRADKIELLERLKSVVGGDFQNVDRKGVSELTNVEINARFTIAANEIPRLPDASAALRSRIIAVPFKVTFEGREDLDLYSRLESELPGITNWALDGLRDLRECGRLTSPKAGMEIIDDLVRLSSPVMGFIQDCCTVDPELTVPMKELQAAWRLWCGENGHERGSNPDFGKKLRAAIPALETTRPRIDGEQQPFYKGLTLTGAAMREVKRVTNDPLRLKL